MCVCVCVRERERERESKFINQESEEWTEIDFRRMNQYITNVRKNELKIYHYFWLKEKKNRKK